MKVLRMRAIVGIVGKVELPCGCHALVALGEAAIRDSPRSRHLTSFRCANWKRHKYAVAAAERELAERLKTSMRQTRKRTANLRKQLCQQ